MSISVGNLPIDMEAVVGRFVLLATGRSFSLIFQRNAVWCSRTLLVGIVSMPLVVLKLKPPLGIK
jgi:hypothetical protein